MSGAVAYYALLALAPFGVIAISVAGWILGEEAARSEFASQVETFVGGDTAAFVVDVVERSSSWKGGWLATTVSLFFLLFASTRLFWMLRAALNYTWGIRSRIPPGFRGLAWSVLKRRLIAFAMVFVFGAALMVTALLKAGLTVAATFFGGVPTLYRILDFSGSVAVLALVVAFVFRWLPDAKISWRDTLIGAFVTSFFATGGAFLIGHYVGRVSPASMYGAAGSLVVLLLWVYYTAQIFFFGAAFTYAYARLEGNGVIPLKHATRVTGDELHPIFEGYDAEPPDEDEENIRSSRILTPEEAEAAVSPEAVEG